MPRNKNQNHLVISSHLQMHLYQTKLSVAIMVFNFTVATDEKNKPGFLM